MTFRAVFLAYGIAISVAAGTPAAAEALAGPALAERLSGNTIAFFSKPQRADVLLYFRADGRAIGRISSIPGRQLHQSWSVAEDGTLCRVLPSQQRPVCSRIEADGDRLRFLAPDGTVQFEATLLPGNRLPGGDVRQAGEAATGGRTPKPPPSLAERFAMIDANGDGKVERSEWTGDPERFKRLDANRDGVLDRAEIERAESKLAERPLLAEARRLYEAPEQEPRHPGSRTDCVFDQREYRFKHFRITGYAPNCAFGGTVLFIDVTDREWPVLYEIDMTGNPVWQYDIGRGAGGRLDPMERAAHPPMDPSRLANGNTLFVMKEYGIFEVDRTGNTVWRHMDDGVSHDADRLADGNTLFVRGWSGHGEDHLREVDRDGRLVWSWKGVAQFTDRIFLPVPTAPQVRREGSFSLYAVEPGYEGWLHANAVTRLADGSTMLSLRNFHRIVFLDRSGAVLRSVPIPFVHDPEIQANGNILANVPPLGVAEYAQGRPVWRMEASDWKADFGVGDIWNVRDANRLPNGNIFVTSGSRLLEIEPSGRPVWQLENTRVEPGIDNQSQAFFKSQRIGPDGRAYGG